MQNKDINYYKYISKDQEAVIKNFIAVLEEYEKKHLDLKTISFTPL